jgi:hypothetical protein
VASVPVAWPALALPIVCSHLPEWLNSTKRELPWSATQSAALPFASRSVGSASTSYGAVMPPATPPSACWETGLLPTRLPLVS